MSLQVNFSTHGHELKAAYEAILQPADPKKDDNWAIFGYDKGTNDLKVLGKGNGGLEELQDEFMDGKIQYAFARIVDPYSQLNKFVFIAWCGDGVPESKKGLFNTHLADVANFLKGYHLQINARCEADVTPQQIMKRAEEGSGSKYSTHQEDYKPERIQPLQSAYKRTVIPDIAAMQRNPTKPESAPQYNIGGTKPLVSPVKPLVSPKPLVNPAPPSSGFPPTPSKLVGRVWPPPASEQSSSSSPSPNVDSPSSSTAAKSWKSVGGGSSYSAASSGTSFIKVQPPSSLTSYGRTSPEPPVVNKAHQLRLEREAREKEERERIKRETAASEARERHVESASTAQKVAEERRLQEQKERERELQQQKNREPEDTPRAPGFNRVRQERELREKEERKRAEAEEASRSAREVAKVREQSAIREQAAAREEDELKRQRELKQRHEREAKEVEERKAQEDEARRRQQEEEEQERLEELRQEEEARRRKQADEERRLGQQKQEEERQLRQQQEEEEEEERRRHYEQEQEERRLQEEAEERARVSKQEVGASAHALHASEDHSEAAPSGSVSAIVLYSYEKAEENEMSLVEGEIIRNVTELDVGWWSGESEDGTRSGLFPANYVKLIEGTTATSGSHEHEQHYQEHEDVLAQSHHDNAHEQFTGAHGTGNQKTSAVALYDYQAGEPNEISFVEGETIVDIDFVTEDWWSGKNESGGVGLFP
ncbi:hypothetical protein BGX34_000707, partial [Mortierella sp. NVP85]